MKERSYARWFVVGGAALAFLSFFLPSIGIETGFFDLGAAVAFADMISEFTSLIIIPLCFFAVIALNIVFHLPSLKPDGKKALYVAEWATLLVGLLFAVYVYFRIADLIGFGFFSITPSMGAFVMLGGVGLAIFGLVTDTQFKSVMAPLINRDPNARFSQPNYYPQNRDELEPPTEDFPSHRPSGYGSSPRSAPARLTGAVPPAAILAERARNREKISAWLVAKDGNNYQLCAGETTIGRAVSNDIQLNDARVSKRHAKITVASGGFHLSDLGSTNGTWLNGSRVNRPTPLRTEDKIRFGDSFTVEFVSIKK